MLDNEKFEVTIRMSKLEQLDDVLKLYATIHCSPDSLFVVKGNAPEVLHFQKSNDSKADRYPIDVLLPMIRYKTKNLVQCNEKYYDGDGTNVAAINICMDHHGIKIKRTYMYAGK